MAFGIAKEKLHIHTVMHLDSKLLQILSIQHSVCQVVMCYFTVGTH